MEQRKDYSIEQCLNVIHKYEKWGNLLAGRSWVHLFNSNAPVSALTIQNCMEDIKAKMKLSVFQDNDFFDKEKYDRLKQIDSDIRHTQNNEA